VKSRALRWSLGRAGTLLFGGVLLLSTGGCPVDNDAVLTETVQAALTAAVNSFVESLSTYLAGT